MHSALLRIRTALARHGVAGTATRGAAALRDWRSLRRGSAIDAAFDREHGVDTAGIIPLDALDVTGRWVSHGNRYEATTPALFHRALDSLEFDLRRFTFVDIGAGKGRALLLASEYPFRRIVGVEFSPELVAVARGNIARWLEKERACREITLVCSDATEYELPVEPLVLYLYNPFDRVVMQSMIARVLRSLRDHPRPVLIVLRGGLTLVEEVLAGGFSELEEGRWPRVFAPGPLLASKLTAVAVPAE